MPSVSVAFRYWPIVKKEKKIKEPVQPVQPVQPMQSVQSVQPIQSVHSDHLIYPIPRDPGFYAPQTINCYCKEFYNINSKTSSDNNNNDELKINMERNIGRINLSLASGYNFCSDECENAAKEMLRKFAIKYYFMQLTADFVSFVFPENICVKRGNGKIESNWKVYIPGIADFDLNHIYYAISTTGYLETCEFGFEEKLFGDMKIPCINNQSVNKSCVFKFIKLADIVALTPGLKFEDIHAKYLKYLMAYWNNDNVQFNRYLFENRPANKS